MAGTYRGDFVGYTNPDGTQGEAYVGGCGGCGNGGNNGYEPQPRLTVSNKDDGVLDFAHDVVTRTVLSTHATVDEGTQFVGMEHLGQYCAQDLTDVAELAAGRPTIHKCHN